MLLFLLAGLALGDDAPTPKLLHRFILIGDTGKCLDDNCLDPKAGPGEPKADDTRRKRRDKALQAWNRRDGRTTLLLLGDLYYDDHNAPVAPILVATLPVTTIPTYAVIGNHEAGGDTSRAKFLDGFKELSKDGRFKNVQVIATDATSPPPTFQDGVCVKFGQWGTKQTGKDAGDPAEPWDIDWVGPPLASATCTWRIVATHHVYGTSFDKPDEQRWGHQPPTGTDNMPGDVDLWLNGHAHQLEGGVYPSRDNDKQVLAITSGAGSKFECPEGTSRSILGSEQTFPRLDAGRTKIVDECDWDEKDRKKVLQRSKAGSPGKVNVQRLNDETKEPRAAWYVPGLGFTVVDVYADKTAWIGVVTVDVTRDDATASECYTWTPGPDAKGAMGVVRRPSALEAVKCPTLDGTAGSGP